MQTLYEFQTGRSVRSRSLLVLTEDTVSQCGGAVTALPIAVIILMNPTARNGVKKILFQKKSPNSW